MANLGGKRMVITVQIRQETLEDCDGMEETTKNADVYQDGVRVEKIGGSYSVQTSDEDIESDMIQKANEAGYL